MGSEDQSAQTDHDLCVFFFFVFFVCVLFTDWLGACAALVLIGLICMVMVSILGSIGLCTQKRPLYIFCAVTAIVSGRNVLCTSFVLLQPLFQVETSSVHLLCCYSHSFG